MPWVVGLCLWRQPPATAARWWSIQAGSRVWRDRWQRHRPVAPDDRLGWQAARTLRRLAILANVGGPAVVLDMREVQAAARTLGLEVIKLEIRRGEDIAPAFEALKGRADALYVCIDPLVNTHRIRINTLALAARLPTMHGAREGVEAAGLMSYGPNLPDLFRRAAEFVDKILRGAKPADIPVEQPRKFDFVINLTTANALGLGRATDTARARRRGDRVT